MAAERDGSVRARKAPPYDGKPVYHGRFKLGGKWGTVRNADGRPIAYMTPEAARAGAKLSAAS